MAWTQGLSAADFNTATGKTLSAVRNIKATICEQDRFYCQAIATDDTLWVGVSTGGAMTWSFVNVGTVTDATVPLGFAVSQHDALKVWSAGADGALRGSVDGAATFSTLHTVTNANSPICNIEVQYADNPDDQIIYISGTTAGGTQLDLSPDKDTFTHDQTRDTNYGAGAYLQIRATTPDGGMWAYTWVHVDLSGVPAGAVVTSAKLYCYVYSSPVGSGGTETKEYDADAAWDEMAITWNTMPATTYRGKAGVSYAPDAWCNFDILTQVNGILAGGDNYGWMFEFTNPNRNIYMRSREYADSAYHPYLRLEGTGLSDSPYLHKSINGGGAFSDVTPTVGGSNVAPLGFVGMEVATLGADTIYALCDDGAGNRYLMVSEDAAGTWAEKADFSSVDPADEDGQVSLGAWPYDVNVGYLLQNRSPGGSPADMIIGSENLFTTWVDKSGDWDTAIQAVWGGTSALSGCVVPIWSP